MTNFKTLSLVGAMLVSTTGVAMAQTPICCPTSVPAGSCVPTSNPSACFIDCIVSPCIAGNSTTNKYTWEVVGSPMPPTTLSGATPEVSGSMLVCKSGEIMAVYHNAPAGYSADQNACGKGIAGFTPPSDEGQRHRDGIRE